MCHHATPTSSYDGGRSKKPFVSQAACRAMSSGSAALHEWACSRPSRSSCMATTAQHCSRVEKGHVSLGGRQSCCVRGLVVGSGSAARGMCNTPCLGPWRCGHVTVRHTWPHMCADARVSLPTLPLRTWRDNRHPRRELPSVHAAEQQPRSGVRDVHVDRGPRAVQSRGSAGATVAEGHLRRTGARRRDDVTPTAASSLRTFPRTRHYTSI